LDRGGFLKERIFVEGDRRHTDEVNKVQYGNVSKTSILVFADKSR
jgi:hypothetical protein